MPTPIQNTDKQNFINLVNLVNPNEALRLQSELNVYEDVNRVIGRQLQEYSERPKYLSQCLATLVDANLVAVGIYNNKTGTNLTDANMIINSTYTGTITIDANQLNVVLLGNSSVGKVLINSNVNLEYLYIGPGSTLNQLDSTATGAFVNNIALPYYRSTPSTLNAVLNGSQIGDVQVGEGSYYGGFSNDNPLATCVTPVTGITATQVTDDSVMISWTPPATYLMIDTFYRKTGSNVWILATTEDGDFMGDSGFTFRTLEPDTFYSFKISTQCINGGIADVFTSVQTNCCGSGNSSMTQYNDCEINVTIKDAPDSSTITLCNGAVINAQYPSGATLTISYLIGKIVKNNVIVGNLNHQNFPFDSTTGTFNAGATPLLLFYDDDVVTVNALLPVM